MREASSRLAQRALLGDFVNVVSIRFAECPHPTLRTTRYSVFKDRSRSWELVESSVQTVSVRKPRAEEARRCKVSSVKSGLWLGNPPASDPRGGRRNLRDAASPRKGNSRGFRAFFSPPRAVFGTVAA